jgi:hypothetical protein
MTTARDIMRGTFRLSIAVAGLAAAYALYERSDAFEEAQNDSLRMTMRLECGARRSEENLKTATVGQIDLAEIGCASKPFTASFDELRKARDGGFRREWQAMEFDFAGAARHALGYALVAFIAVNLLGLALASVRAVVGWIAAGYRPAP